MIEQLKTIRAGLETATCYSMLGVDAHSVQIALTALTQLEAMVSEQKPVAFVNGAALSRLKNGESVPAYNCWGSPWPTPLYAAPVAQQPQAEAVPTFDEQLREVAKRAIPQQAEAVENKLNFCQECGSKINKQIPVLLKGE